MPSRRSRRGEKLQPFRTRYLFVCGGVMSGVGKGTAVASIGRILLSKGFRVTAMKIDPYLNIDAGTMNPTEHGEVFVTADGLETDQDLGNYERFFDQHMTRINYMTLGQVYQTVLSQERAMYYGGKCVEMVTHIPKEVIHRIERLTKQTKAEIVLIEIGGTVGEYQNLVFLEAARLMRLKNPRSVQFVMVSYLPIPSKIGEMKTKPTQHAVQRLNSAGIQADFLLCRSQLPLDQRRREKLSINCNISEDNVIAAPDVDSIYDIPVNLNREHLGEKILSGFDLAPRRKDLQNWTRFTRRMHRLTKTLRVGIVGKYFATGGFVLSDSYISVIESIKHAAWALGFQPQIDWLNAEEYENAPGSLRTLELCDGVIIPGGFGARGTEGKILAIRYCREHDIPLFGLCFGMQLSVIEFARHVLKLKNANSTELDPATHHPVIDLMVSQKEHLRLNQYGATMRLGDFRCRLLPGTLARHAYGKKEVSERHRHRWEVNNAYAEKLRKAGMLVSGINPESQLAEIVEIPRHPFFVGVQFHPEFLSRPLSPHPLFLAFGEAAKKRSVKKRFQSDNK